MALKAIIHKATLQIADMDRHVYVDHSVTIARHPSETDERMMVRLLALGLNLPADSNEGTLELAKDLWDTDEPALWHKDLTGAIRHWVDVGQPDEKRLLRACGRADRVTVLAYASSAPTWWAGVQGPLARADRLEAWRIEPAQSQALAALAQRTMQLQLSVQDGHVWVGNGEESVDIAPIRLNPR